MREPERDRGRKKERERILRNDTAGGRERGLERKRRGKGKDGVQLFPPHTRAAYMHVGTYLRPFVYRRRETTRYEDPSVGIGY